MFVKCDQIFYCCNQDDYIWNLICIVAFDKRLFFTYSFYTQSKIFSKFKMTIVLGSYFASDLWPQNTKDNFKVLLPVLNSFMWHQYLKRSTSWTTECRAAPLQSLSLTKMKGIHSVTTTASQHCSPPSSG